MSITTHREPSRDLTTLVADGQLSFDEIYEVIKNINTKNVLLELIDTGIASLSPDEIDLLSHRSIRYAERRRGGKTALVALNKGDFEFANLFKALTGEAPRILKVFRNMDEAREWLSQ